jgi:hypothetical protein
MRSLAGENSQRLFATELLLMVIRLKISMQSVTEKNLLLLYADLRMEYASVASFLRNGHQNKVLLKTKLRYCLTLLNRGSLRLKMHQKLFIISVFLDQHMD